jgi:hypothetical protein
MAKKAWGKNLASKHKKSRKRKAVPSWSESGQEEPVLTDADDSDWQDEDAECFIALASFHKIWQVKSEYSVWNTHEDCAETFRLTTRVTCVWGSDCEAPVRVSHIWSQGTLIWATAVSYKCSHDKKSYFHMIIISLEMHS